MIFKKLFLILIAPICLLPILFLKSTFDFSEINAQSNPYPIQIGTLYDNDAVEESARPDGPGGSWYYLNPNEPNLPPNDGKQYRHSTPIFGLYEAKDPKIIKQHAYWLTSAGFDHVIVAWTNLKARDDPDNQGQYREWTEGVKEALDSLLNTYSQITDFSVPKVTVAIRMQPPDVNLNATRIANEVYEFYQRYPDLFFKFDDGTINKNKPVLIVFFDDTNCAWTQSQQWNDTRFHNKFTNGYFWGKCGGGYFEPQGFIKDNLAYWLFVENSKLSNGEYRDLYKRQSPTERQQMAIWIGVHQSGLDWDYWGKVWNGKTTFEHQLANVLPSVPRALWINRFNYYSSWYSQPQEGLTEIRSASFEPTTTMGFEKIYTVTKAAYSLKSLSKTPPLKSQVEVINISSDKATISFFSSLKDLKDLNYPQEYAISSNPNQTGAWKFINVNDKNIEVNLNGNDTFYLALRNAFGISPTTEVNIEISPPLNLSPGWNQITWPDILNYTAKTALEDIDNDCGAGTAAVIATRKKDWWEKYVQNYGGENFSLQSNQSYHIKVNKSCNWTP